MEGSVRKVGDTITINAQLISTETGAHIWAERFEGERSKLRRAAGRGGIPSRQFAWR
jgi:TolB-like protein